MLVTVMLNTWPRNGMWAAQAANVRLQERVRIGTWHAAQVVGVTMRGRDSIRSSVDAPRVLRLAACRNVPRRCAWATVAGNAFEKGDCPRHVPEAGWYAVTGDQWSIE
jgi:hypothetical protein